MKWVYSTPVSTNKISQNFVGSYIYMQKDIQCEIYGRVELPGRIFFFFNYWEKKCA